MILVLAILAGVLAMVSIYLDQFSLALATTGFTIAGLVFIVALVLDYLASVDTKS
jgi:hypothetical protein